MVEMIETVLSYTQSEINIETKRRVSLLSIVQTIVTDFQDDGYPVTLSPYVTPKQSRELCYLIKNKLST